jgi:hypothetical protein
MLHWILPVVGALLIAMVMLDIFLTVLYARIGTASSVTALPAGCGDCSS